MQSNQVAAYGILGSLCLAVLAAILTDSVGEAGADAMYSIAGLGMFIFGIWAAVKLLPKKQG